MLKVSNNTAVNKASLILAMLISVSACRPYQTPEKSTSSVMEVEKTGNGKTIASEKALEILMKYASPENFQPYVEKSAGYVHYQAGYIEKYLFGGASYKLGASAENSKVYVRKGEQKMYYVGANTQGQEAGSTSMDHTALMRANFDVMIRSLKGQGGYTQIVATDDDATGTLANGKISTGPCELTLSFSSPAKKIEGFYTVCEKGLVGKVISSSGGFGSAVGFVIQADEG